MISDEVNKLMGVSFISKVMHKDWLMNVEVLKKENATRKYEYIDLNKACLKESYPLSRIDQLVDSIVSHELHSFLYAYSGYYY